MKNKKLILAVVAVVVLVAVMAVIWFVARPAFLNGSKAITVVVVHADGTEKTFEYVTTAKKLGGFLEQEGIICSEGADAGMFHTVDGEKADWSENKSYWAFYIDGEYAVTGIFDTPITDGAVYKLVYTIG